MFTDAQKTDIRRFCGYPAYGAAPAGNMGWRFYQAYGALEYRMNNLSPSEVNVVTAMLATLNALEQAVPAAGDNLDTAQAAVWTHNRREVQDRADLLALWGRRLCAFFGVPPGAALQSLGGSSNLSLVI